jgi:hypothetical protein
MIAAAPTTAELEHGMIESPSGRSSVAQFGYEGRPDFRKHRGRSWPPVTRQLAAIGITKWMRFEMPRMTTRRWLIAIAALAASLGCFREAIRLKRQRAEYLDRAAWHAEGETYYRRMIASFDTTALQKKREAQELAAQETMAGAQKDNAFDRTMELWFGSPAENGFRAVANDHDRWSEVRARDAALAVKSQRIIDEYYRGRMVRHRRLADYHAALAQKYEHFAAHPWLPVVADPPRPE